MRTFDVSWHGYSLWLWATIEVDVGILCASLPACKPLLTSFRRKISTERSDAEKAGKSGSGRFDKLDPSSDNLSPHFGRGEHKGEFISLDDQSVISHDV
jgi:hypothetical protein